MQFHVPKYGSNLHPFSIVKFNHVLNLLWSLRNVQKDSRFVAGPLYSWALFRWFEMRNV